MGSKYYQPKKEKDGYIKAKARTNKNINFYKTLEGHIPGYMLSLALD